MAELDKKELAAILRQMKLEGTRKFATPEENIVQAPQNARPDLNVVQYRPESGFNIAGGGSKSKDATVLGGRIGYKQPINDKSSIEAGLSGHYAKGQGWKDVGLDRADLNYANQVTDNLRLQAGLGAGRGGINEGNVNAKYSFKKGGKVKKVAKPKVRGHGIEKKGKTKGRFV